MFREIRATPETHEKSAETGVSGAFLR